ncbi:MAG TPA: glycosyltransferase family 1 protein [Microbacteriaceae bacterium]|nr:glycosyltransferase family 1 protein [Microbacteriaceae bacterium]
MSLVGKAFHVLREQGLREVVRRIGSRLDRGDDRGIGLVRFDDAEAVDWRTPHPAVATPSDRGPGPWSVAWIMSPPGENSGGHQNLFRFLRVLEEAGHRCVVYLYSNDGDVSAAASAAVVRDSPSYPDVAAEFRVWTGEVPAEIDAIFATGWETAYPSFRSASMARRFYFVQDFEPWFTGAGTASALAEATYRFGFRGITAGGWLEQKLNAEYGMHTDRFDFGADPAHYRLLGDAGPRNEVLFYARRTTDRRGLGLGLMALDLVAKARPDVTINLVGEDLTGLTIPFAHENLYGLSVNDLGPIYNRCAAGLVLSFSNLSLLPLELLAAGTIPVVNNAPNNRLVSDHPAIVYTEPIPAALADAILEVLDDPDSEGRALRAAESTEGASWTMAGKQFLDAFGRGMA